MTSHISIFFFFNFSLWVKQNLVLGLWFYVYRIVSEWWNSFTDHLTFLWSELRHLYHISKMTIFNPPCRSFQSNWRGQRAKKRQEKLRQLQSQSEESEKSGNINLNLKFSNSELVHQGSIHKGHQIYCSSKLGLFLWYYSLRYDSGTPPRIWIKSWTIFQNLKPKKHDWSAKCQRKTWHLNL